jgi:formamidopyrimidine-DNA glycosylase
VPERDEVGTFEQGDGDARYAYFVSKLDCEVCGDEIEVEGDVTNGQEVFCEVCQKKRIVYGR